MPEKKKNIFQAIRDRVNLPNERLQRYRRRPVPKDKKKDEEKKNPSKFNKDWMEK